MMVSYPVMMTISVRKGTPQVIQVKFNLVEMQSPWELIPDDNIPSGEHSQNIALSHTIKNLGGHRVEVEIVK